MQLNLIFHEIHFYLWSIARSSIYEPFFFIHWSGSVKAKSFQMNLLVHDVCSLLFDTLLRASAPCWLPGRCWENRVGDDLRYSEQPPGIVRGDSWPPSWFVQHFIIHSLYIWSGFVILTSGSPFNSHPDLHQLCPHHYLRNDSSSENSYL